MADSEIESKNPDEAILSLARERFELAVEAERELRKVALEDLNFRIGEQWPAEIKRDREAESRPCLTINRIPQFIRQITNDQRQNRPATKVYPVDEQGDVETAKIFQGLIRHIEKNSNADAAYDTAFEGAATKGFGFYRFVTDYVSPTSFNQEILIKRIRNAFSVYLDPFAKEPDASDASWGFIFEDISNEEYKETYPKSDICDAKDWATLGAQFPGWVQEKSVRVAEYFYKEFEDVEIALLNTGESVEKSNLPEQLPEGISIVKERMARVPKVKWCKINATEILEKTDWLGQYIPIVPVYGDEVDREGQVFREGVIRHAKDSQRMYNYHASTETEAIALAPKAPFIIAEGQIPPEYANQWKTANIKTHAFLPYKPITTGGQAVPPPQRNSYEPAVMAITQARMGAAEDMKATTGIYDSSLGNRSNEVSGVAIRGRQMQSQTSNFHFIDNLSRSLRHGGRIMVDLIPKIYDTAQAARIIGDEGDQEIVKINEAFERKGKMVNYDLTVGKYDVIIETGPSYATRRQEAAATMMDFAKSNPQQASMIADLIAKNMDWPGASEIAERLKKLLPPGIAEDDKNQAPLPPQAQQQIQQMNQMIEQLTGHLNEANEKIKMKTVELESKERIEFAKMENAIVLEQMQTTPLAAMKLVMEELAHLNARLELVGISKPIDYELNGSGPEQAASPNNQQQLTGEFTPGNNMGV